MTEPTEIDELALQITAASEAYYNEEALITDEDFDALQDRLRSLSPSHPVLRLVGAPAAHLSKASHSIPMGSLNKITNDAELEKFVQSVAGNRALPVFVIQPKYDGSSLSLIYKHGKLVQAITRGDGIIGEDVTANALRIPSIPAQLSSRVSCSVRGEIVLGVREWEKIQPLKTSNPRNVGNGTLRRTDGSNAELLAFRAYDILPEVGPFSKTEQEKITLLQGMGFEATEFEVCRSVAELQSRLNAMLANRSFGRFQIDGAVIKADSVELQEALGVTSGRPKGQTAYKWESAVGMTKLIDVVLTVGHTGFIIPTGKLETIQLMGTQVSSVLLNNWDQIKRLDVAIGDTVVVSKRGDIIPFVERVAIRPANRRPIVEPTVCPACGGPARRTATGAITVCVSDDCGAKTTGRVKKWVKNLNILGIGDELLESLTTGEDPVVKDPADLYTLSKAVLADLPMGAGRVGDSRAASIVGNIQAARSCTLDTFLGSLGIKHLGRRRVEIIRSLAGGQLDTLEDWMTGKLVSLAGVCQVQGMVGEISEGFVASLPVIDRLLRHLTIMKPTQAKEKAPSAQGQRTFCLTGKMTRGRKEIEADIVAAGHLAADDIKAGVTLVQAFKDSVSSKSKKALSKGCDVISEDELMAFLSK